MNSENLFHTLRDGNKMPLIGFGPGIYSNRLAYPKRPWSPYGIIKRGYNKFVGAPSAENSFINAISSALVNGFRLIDYSETYGGYKYVREGIRRSGINRNEFFLTTRIGNSQQMKGRETIRESFMRGLDELKIDYFDLLQFHWPVTDVFTETWQEMIKLREEGLVKTLGVANCNIHHLEALFKSSGEWPVVNQFEVHPLFTQKNLIDFCKNKGITVEAYTPIARHDDRLVRLPLLREIGKKYKKNLVQIVLRWHIQNGIIPVVKAMNPQHQKSNLDIFDFELTDEEIKRIDGININSRLRYDPDNCDFTIL